ncbi:MAG TPA: hypothetical protein VG347_12515 [Verrucomicrobiae bacterium]|nr:hypothetical protein [Verrucomicrobiae bacterium]
MKIGKLSQIKPDKASMIYDSGFSINESLVRPEVVEYLNHFVRAKASAFASLWRDRAVNRTHFKRFARYINRVAVAKLLECGCFSTAFGEACRKGGLKYLQIQANPSKSNLSIHDLRMTIYESWFAGGDCGWFGNGGCRRKRPPSPKGCGATGRRGCCLAVAVQDVVGLARGPIQSGIYRCAGESCGGRQFPLGGNTRAGRPRSVGLRCNWLAWSHMGFSVEEKLTRETL